MSKLKNTTLKWYEVWSPEISRGGYYSPPEEFFCWALVQAPNKREAKKLALKESTMRDWILEARGDNANPFSKLTVKEALCEHGVCWATTECTDCLKDWEEECN